MSPLRLAKRVVWGMAVSSAAGALAVAAPSVTVSPSAGTRRLTVSQYRNCLTDLLGPGLRIPPLEDEPTAGGFSTTAAARVGSSFYAVERYDAAAFAVVQQVFGDADRRRALLGCEPTSPVGSDCLDGFLRRFGRRAFRRSLSADEISRYHRLATGVVATQPDVWRGVSLAVAAMLQSPKFLYRIEPGAGQHHRYSSHEMASRLSFFLWNSGPDEALLDVADADGLSSTEGLEQQTQRLLSSPRARLGMRDFFSELMRLPALRHLAREVRLFTAMTPTLGASMQEETLRGFEHNVFDAQGDFRDLLRGRDTFVNQELARLYGLPNVGTDGFVRTRLPVSSHRVGLLGQASFLAGSAGVEETSPTARGKFVREVVLCEDVAPPPGNVDTSLPRDSERQGQTLRQRLVEHRQDRGCAHCHEQTDSIGFAFEHFDALGQYRARQHGTVIDAAGRLDGRWFNDAAGLSAVLGRDARVAACLVRNLYRYATGAVASPGEAAAVKSVARQFAKSGYRVQHAVRALVTSDGFRQAPQPPGGEP